MNICRNQNFKTSSEKSIRHRSGIGAKYASLEPYLFPSNIKLSKKMIFGIVVHSCTQFNCPDLVNICRNQNYKTSSEKSIRYRSGISAKNASLEPYLFPSNIKLSKKMIFGIVVHSCTQFNCPDLVNICRNQNYKTSSEKSIRYRSGISAKNASLEPYLFPSNTFSFPTQVYISLT